MNCKDVRSKQSEFLDGELDAAVRAEVLAHLDACAECRRELRELEQTIALLHGIEEVEVPASLAVRVRARIAAGTARPTGGGVWRFISSPQFRVAAAACMLFGICTYGLYYSSGGAHPEKREEEKTSIAKIQVRQDKVGASGERNLTVETAVTVGERRGNGSAVVGHAADAESAEASQGLAVPMAAMRAPAARPVVAPLAMNRSSLLSARAGMADPLPEVDAAVPAAARVSAKRMSGYRAAPVPTPAEATAAACAMADVPQVATESPTPRAGLYVGNTYRASEDEDGRVVSCARAAEGASGAKQRALVGHEGESAFVLAFVPANQSGGDDYDSARAILPILDKYSVREEEKQAKARSAMADDARKGASADAKIRHVQIRQADYPKFIEELRKLGAVTVVPEASAAGGTGGSASASESTEEPDGRTLLIHVKVLK